MITETSFQSNSSKSKGGAAFVKGLLTLTGSTFTNNTVDSAGAGNASGGGVHTESPATVTGSTFTGNQAKCTGCSFLNGGGLSIALPVADQSAITVTDSTFEGNNGWFGGGLSAGYGTLNISRCTFRNNHAGYGAGLEAYILNGDHLLFQNNSAVNKGGGVSARGAAVTNSRFISNSAGGGGGISAANGNLTVTNVLLAQNSASSLGGAALLIENLPATVFYATIAQPSRGNGSGIKVSAGATLTLKNSILADCATGLEVSGGNATQDYNLFFNNGSNSAVTNGGTITTGGHSLTGLDPRLADPTGGDYHLTTQSPAIGAGTDLGITTDLDDRLRLNGRFDIGAYQFWTLPTVSTDSATNITTNSAALNGTVNANDGSTTVTFQYGLTTSYGATVTADQSPVTGSSNTPVSKAIAGLTPSTSYHCRVVGVNSAGTTYGNDLTFTTGFQIDSYYLYLPMILR